MSQDPADSRPATAKEPALSRDLARRRRASLAIPPLMIAGGLLFIAAIAVEPPLRLWLLAALGLCFFIAWRLSLFTTRGKRSPYVFEMEMASRGWQAESFEYTLANNRFGRGRLDDAADMAAAHGYEPAGPAMAVGGRLVATFVRAATPGVRGAQVLHGCRTPGPPGVLPAGPPRTSRHRRRG